MDEKNKNALDHVNSAIEAYNESAGRMPLSQNDAVIAILLGRILTALETLSGQLAAARDVQAAKPIGE